MSALNAAPPSASVRPPAASMSRISTLRASQAGARPMARPVSIDAARVNSRTFRSDRICRSVDAPNPGRNATSASTPHQAASTPSAPPATEMRSVSESSWRARRRSAGPEREAHRQIALPRCRPRQKEAREVRAPEHQQHGRRSPASPVRACRSDRGIREGRMPRGQVQRLERLRASALRHRLVAGEVLLKRHVQVGEGGLAATRPARDAPSAPAISRTSARRTRRSGRSGRRDVRPAARRTREASRRRSCAAPRRSSSCGRGRQGRARTGASSTRSRGRRRGWASSPASSRARSRLPMTGRMPSTLK